MGVLFGLILLGILSIVFFVSYWNNRDLFSPLCFFSLFQALRYIPGLLWKDKEMEVSFTDSNLARFFIVELVAIFSVCLGYYLHNHFFYRRNVKYVEKNRGKKENAPLLLIIIIYLIGLYGRLRLIISSGGLLFIINNTHRAYIDSGAGSGYTSMLEQLMLVGIIMQIRYISCIPKENRYKRVINSIICIVMMALSMGSYLIYSRRSPALELLMIAVFAYNYLIREIRIRDIIKPKVLLVVLTVFLIVVIMPYIRSGSSISISTVKEASVFNEFSYLGRDVGCYEHFSQNDKWYGKSYINLLTSPIPSAIMENKPPVDDGMYLCNILRGYDVAPPAPVSQLPVYSSYPFSTQGIMYANFGIFGVLFGELIMGAIYGRIYKILRNTKSEYMVIVFQLVIYQLELSTLSIVQTLIPLLTTYVAFKFFKGIRIAKEQITMNNDNDIII